MSRKQSVLSTLQVSTGPFFPTWPGLLAHILIVMLMSASIEIVDSHSTCTYTDAIAAYVLGKSSLI